MKYTKPIQDSKGMWVVEITTDDGRLTETVKRTTKKAIIDYIKKECK